MTGATPRPADRPVRLGESAPPEPAPPGRRLVDANRWFTAVFVVWTGLAVGVKPLRLPLAALDVAALVAGCVLYLLAYATAVSRSRTDAIGLGALFFLTDQAAPAPVRRSFWLWTSVQVVVSVAAAAVRPFTPVAFGVLVPIIGLGLMGLWGARHGAFPSRFDDDPAPGPGAGATVHPDPSPTAEPAPSTRDGGGMEQNDDHG